MKLLLNLKYSHGFDWQSKLVFAGLKSPDDRVVTAAATQTFIFLVTKVMVIDETLAYRRSYLAFFVLQQVVHFLQSCLDSINTLDLLKHLCQVKNDRINSLFTSVTLYKLMRKKKLRLTSNPKPEAFSQTSP